MSYPEIIHHGAISSVTGSCHQLCADAVNNLLIDCGGSQDNSSSGKAAAFGFDPAAIKAVILTHVHHDHVGRLPELIAAGYAGPVLCSEPSAHLLPLVIEDSLRLQVGNNSKKISEGVQVITKKVIALPFDHWFTLVDNEQVVCKVRLLRAGHILGSAYVECDLQYRQEQRSERVVFSGDLGAGHTPMLPDPTPPERADILVLESTYGNRSHAERSSRQSRLERIIDRALEDQGTVLIPAFSIGRTQELLYELEDILQRKQLSGMPVGTSSVAGPSGEMSTLDWPQLPIILDSPLASRFTQVYNDFVDYWDDEAQERLEEGRKPLGFRQLITIESHDQHLKTVNYLASTRRPAIVVAGNGMCAGGRIVNYLKAMLADPRHNVVFVGYQAKGTPGAAIQAHGPQGGYVEFDRERYAIRAGVETASGYSAHADQDGLVDFVTGMKDWPRQIRLVHGEAQAKKTLGQILQRKYSLARRELELIIPSSEG